jgi:hypothetical protein
MTTVVRSPLLVFACSLVALRLSVKIGALLGRRLRPLREDEREDFSIVLASTLTLLGLIIGFTFSMAISRYDQRKDYEEAEANAIGTEFVRADLLSPADAARLRELLRSYLDQRVLFYKIRDKRQLELIDGNTSQLQSELWSAVRTAAVRPTPVSALVLSGMNDVLNSQGYTQAAWWNRIPVAAWGLMAAIAILCNVLIGYNAHSKAAFLYSVLPFVVSISFFLIADIDTPRSGIIRVVPQNLERLVQSMNTH